MMEVNMQWTAEYQRLWEALEKIDPVTPAGERALAERERAADAAQAAQDRRKAYAEYLAATKNLTAHHRRMRERLEKRQETAWDRGFGDLLSGR